MVGSRFQSAHIVTQVVEVIYKVFQPTDDDTKYILFQMENTTIQTTQILPQLVQKMQKIQTIMM